MLLPKKMLKKIAKICRSFLWKGKEESSSPRAVAWKQLCKARATAGLGVQNVELWNKDAVFKHFWAVTKKKNNLWVRWIHHMYVKEGELWERKASNNNSSY